MSNGKPTVLVVDDEHVIADTLAIILNQNGFEALPFTPARTPLIARASFAPISSSATSSSRMNPLPALT